MEKQETLPGNINYTSVLSHKWLSAMRFYNKPEMSVFCCVNKCSNDALKDNKLLVMEHYPQHVEVIFYFQTFSD